MKTKVFIIIFSLILILSAILLWLPNCNSTENLQTENFSDTSVLSGQSDLTETTAHSTSASQITTLPKDPTVTFPTSNERFDSESHYSTDIPDVNQPSANLGTATNPGINSEHGIELPDHEWE